MFCFSTRLRVARDFPHCNTEGPKPKTPALFIIERFYINPEHPICRLAPFEISISLPHGYLCARWFRLVPSSSRIDKSTTLLALIEPSFLST